MTANVGQDNLIARWVRAGVLFNAEPARRSPDLERLLLDTGRCAPGHARLFTMAVTWLSRYGALIGKHRLRRLIREELETEHRPAMGLMLDLAIEAGAPVGLRVAIEECQPAREPGPLFEASRRNPALRKLAQKHASEASRRWGCWARPIELKTDALRPASWMMRHNPDYIRRAGYRGDLRTSIVETLAHDLRGGMALSAAALSRLCLASRDGLRRSLDALQLEGIISRVNAGKATRVHLGVPA